jgi:mono/diheme cytochrome c family protein
MMNNTSILLVAAAALGFAVACSSLESNDHRREGEKHEAREHDSRASRASEAVLEQGRGLYRANCAACHGETGKGDGPGAGVLKPPPRDHTDRAYMSTLTDKQIAEIIKMGGAMKGKPLMPSHPQFKDAQLAALVAYVRSLSEHTK